VRSTRLSNHERACLFYDASRDLTSTLRVCLGRIRYFLEAAARLKRVRFSVNCPRILQLRSRRHALGYGEQPSDKDQGDWSLSIGPPWQHWVSLYETPFRKAELVRRSSFSDSQTGRRSSTISGKASACGRLSEKKAREPITH
jgi:hypothetical protein